MPRQKKDGHYINYYIDRETYERLEKYCEVKGQTKTAAIERILKQHFDNENINLRLNEE